MATKRPTRPSSRNNKSNSKLGSFIDRLNLNSPKRRFLVFMLVFVLLGGGYMAYRSFAQTPGPYTPLYFIKTKNGAGCKVEVHRVTGLTNYQNPDIHSSTWFGCADSDNGIWQMVDGDLYFIKTKNTGSGRIEVHTATRDSNYTRGAHYATAYGQGEINNGTFQMVGKDLYFIKVRNTGGTIEVHAVTGASGYQTFSVHSATSFGLADADNGSWRMYGTDLALVKTKNTPGNKVELHVVTRGSNYKAFSVHASTFYNISDNANGYFWVVDANADGQPDLGFVKRINTGTGKVEIFYAEAPNYGSLAVATPSWFSPADAYNGTWYIDSQIIKPAPPPVAAPAPAPPPKPSGYICVGTTVITVASRDACKAILTYGSNGNAAYVYAQMIASDQANAGGPASTAPVPGQPTTPAPPTPTEVGTPTIQIGSTGGAVSNLQSRLATFGYWIAPSGNFDSATQTVVKDFQARRGIAADGVVGPQTWSQVAAAEAQGWKLSGLGTPQNPGPQDPGPAAGVGTCFLYDDGGTTSGSASNKSRDECLATPGEYLYWRALGWAGPNGLELLKITGGSQGLCEIYGGGPSYARLGVSNGATKNECRAAGAYLGATANHADWSLASQGRYQVWPTYIKRN